MSRAIKHSVLFFLTLSLISTFILATSLSAMQLRPGLPFPGSEPSQNGTEQLQAMPPGESYSATILQGIFALIFLVLMFYLPARLLTLANLKKIWGVVIILVILFALISLLPRITPAPSAPLVEEYSEAPISPAVEFTVSPLGEPPQALVWLVLAGLGVGVTILGISIAKRRPVAAADDPLKQEAMKAVDALNAGRAFKDVIVQCYMRMVYVLQDERGMQRDSQMTVREFEALLGARGIPPAPVHQLTNLFEKVRYGKQPASEDDQWLGMECLNQIVRFCGSGTE